MRLDQFGVLLRVDGGKFLSLDARGECLEPVGVDGAGGNVRRQPVLKLVGGSGVEGQKRRRSCPFVAMMTPCPCSSSTKQ